MKTTTKTVREEFDEKGNLLVRETTEIVEDDSKPVSPWVQPLGGGFVYTNGNGNIKTQTWNGQDDLTTVVTDVVEDMKSSGYSTGTHLHF
jgi:hypothetical protein